MMFQVIIMRELLASAASQGSGHFYFSTHMTQSQLAKCKRNTTSSTPPNDKNTRTVGERHEVQIS